MSYVKKSTRYVMTASVATQRARIFLTQPSLEDRTMTRSIPRLAAGLMLLAAPLAAQVHPGVTVRVHAPRHLLQHLDAVYLGRSGDTLMFGNDERAPIRLPASAITQLEVSRGTSRLLGAGRGAMWGAATMAILGAFIVYSADYDPNVDGAREAFVLTSAGAGAELGAIIGAFIPKRRYAVVDPQLLLNVVGRPDRPSVGVRFALAYSR